MGRKKRSKKNLEVQLQLSVIFEGVFDSQLITSILKDVNGDYETALERLMYMKSMINENKNHSTSLLSHHDTDIDQVQVIFPSCDREVISFMLIENDHHVERVIDLLSATEHSDDTPLPLPTSRDIVYETSLPLSSESSSIIEEASKSVTESLNSDDESTSNNPYEFMKFVLADFMHPQKIQSFLEERHCTESSSPEHLQNIMNELLISISENTTIADVTSDNVEVRTNPAAYDEEWDTDIILYHAVNECLLENSYDNNINYDNNEDFLEAKRIIKNFFTTLAEPITKQVTDAMIDTALDLSKKKISALPVSVYDPDTAIRCIYEEITAKQNLKSQSA